MKLAICTRSDANIKNMTDITHPIISVYANAWNVDEFIVLNSATEIVNQIGKNKKDYLFYQHYRILSVKNLLEKYDRVLCIDSDVIITPKCPNPFEIIPYEKIGTIYEDVGSRKEDRLRRMQKAQDRFGFIGWRHGYINTGFFMCSKCHSNIFDPINNQLWDDKGYDDVFLGYQIHKNKIPVYELDYKYNHMGMFHEAWKGHPNRFESYVIHYAGRGIFQPDKFKNRLQQIKHDKKVIYG